MSRILRANNVFSDDAENANPAAGKRGSHGMMGGLVKKAYNTRGTARQRAALGDISNQVKPKGLGDGTKKQRVLLTSQVSLQNRRRGSQGKAMQQDEYIPNSRRTSMASVQSVPNSRMSMGSAAEEDDREDMDMGFDLEDDVNALSLHTLPVDEADRANPQAVVDLIPDIMTYLRRNEKRRLPSATYMAKQTDINAKMREILIDWLIEVHLKFKLRLETLFLTVNLIDRFLQRRAVSRTKLQLVGCTAMLIASKYEEIYPPEVRDFVYISDKAYTREQILAMESIMLNTLEFNLTVPTPFRFGERFAKVAGGEGRNVDQCKLNHCINFLMESVLQKYAMLHHLPSVVAASSTYLAMQALNVARWTSTMESQTGYSEVDLSECIQDIKNVIRSDQPKYRAVFKKYSNAKFDEVAKLVI